MKKCKNCSNYEYCKPFVSPDESFPEKGGCDTYRSKKLLSLRKMLIPLRKMIFWIKFYIGVDDAE